MKRVLSALLVLMLVLALLPASALAETPYTRADAAVYLAETFGLADIHASRIEGYETTPKEMGYSASSDAITAANVIAAAKDCVDLPRPEDRGRYQRAAPLPGRRSSQLPPGCAHHRA